MPEHSGHVVITTVDVTVSVTSGQGSDDHTVVYDTLLLVPADVVAGYELLDWVKASGL
jgi:hypothetical protein